MIKLHLVLPERKLMAKQFRRKDSAGAVLQKGEGQRKDGRYYFEWTDRYEKRHFIYGATLDELRDKKSELAISILEGLAFDKSNMTLNDAIEYWRKIREDDVAIGALKPTTLSQYLIAYNNHARDSFGNLKIKDITKTKLETFYKQKMASGLGLSQIANIAKPINQALAIAEDENWIRKSPAKRAIMPVVLAEKRRREKEYTGIKALTPEQQGLLTGWLETDPDRTPLRCIVNTFLSTGLRIGELAALQKSDVKSDFISVRHSYAYFSTEIDGERKMVRLMQGPKSRAANRDIPLIQSAIDAIEEYQEWTGRNDISLVEPINGFDSFIFLTRKGWPHTDAGINVALKRAVATINKEQQEKGSSLLLPSISCHWLRRTFATRLCEAGVSLKVAQYLLGHESINMTANVYTAVQSKTAQREMLRLEKTGADFAPTPVQQKYNKFSDFLL